MYVYTYVITYERTYERTISTGAAIRRILEPDYGVSRLSPYHLRQSVLFPFVIEVYTHRKSRRNEKVGSAPTFRGREPYMEPGFRGENIG